MRKNILLTIISILIITVLLIAAIPTKEILARLEIRNKSEQSVKISLNGDGHFYFLTVKPYSTQIFTVERALYSQTTYSCGLSASGALDMTTNVRLVFPPCNRKTESQGTPTIEKINLSITTSIKTWKWKTYQYK